MNDRRRLAGFFLAAFLVAGASDAAGAPAGYTRNVAIVLYEGVEILDFAGPTEVFQSASGFGEAEVTLTVCTGVFALAKTPLVEGKAITTWYGALENLKKAAPLSTVQAGRRFIDNDRFVTTAGVSAGIDGSLHLVARLLGRAIADRTARYMEYHWTPEAYLSERYQLLNPSTDARGRSLQLAQIHVDEGRAEEAARICRDLLAKNPKDASAAAILASIDRKS